MRLLAIWIAVCIMAAFALACNPPADTEDEAPLPAATGLTPDEQPAEVTPAEAPEEGTQPPADEEEPAGRDTSNLPTKIKVGDQLPTFSFATIDEKKHSIEEFIGKPLIINFWGINCPPCREELPELVKFYEKYKGEGLEIITLNLDASLDKQRKFLEYQEMPWVVGYDDTEMFRKWNYRYIPTSILVDPNGTVVDERIGGMSLDDLESSRPGLFGEG
ncbi:redoxin domain-containing protein [bacterium]|nr:redoxin domain-containing protein [bacterium]